MKPAILFVLGGYKRWISPMLPHACRFVPTCSEYAVEAVERHGVGKGSWLAARRLLRCQPFASAGFDPVPAEKSCGSQPHVQVDAAALDSDCGPIHRHYGMESHIGRI